MKTKIGLILLACILLTGCASVEKQNILFGKTTTVFEGVFEQHAKANGISINDSKKMFEEYGIINEKDILKNLPKKTETFTEEQKWINGGEGISLGEISENNYKQPDFYPTFQTSGIKTWTQATGERPVVIGLMSTPADQEATLNEESRGFETYLFVGAGWGTTTHQGVKLQTVIEPQGSGINVKITPNEFLLGPTFPILDENWIERVHIEGIAPPEVRAGEYTISIFLGDPTVSNENEWETKNADYVRANNAFLDTRGLATLTLHVK